MASHRGDRRPSPSLVCVGFVVERMAPGRFFSEYCGFPLSSVILQCFIFVHLITDARIGLILAIDCVVQGHAHTDDGICAVYSSGVAVHVYWRGSWFERRS